MYLRAAHVEKAIPVLRDLIRQNPLGILTTAIPSETAPLIQSSHIPFLLDVEDDTSEMDHGILRAHIARQNPQAKTLIEAAKQLPASAAGVLEQEVLVLFQSPVHHYVTPKFYIETKPDTGKVVPTWNYAAAQAYGKAKIYYDSNADESKTFLAKQIDDLSSYAEESIMGYNGVGSNLKAWKVADAPEKYISLLTKNIIGIEIQIERLEGKFKMSQEMGAGDREGVAKGFEALDSEVGHQMAGTVRERGNLL